MSDNMIKTGIEIKAGVKGLEEIARLTKSLESAGSDVSLLTAKGKALAESLASIGQNQETISSFKNLKQESAQLHSELSKAQQNLQALNTQMKSGVGSQSLTQEFKNAQNEVDKLKQRKKELTLVMRELRKNMSQAGIDVNKLTQEEARLGAQSHAVQNQIKNLSDDAKKLKQIAEDKVQLGLDVDDKTRRELLATRRAFLRLKNSGTLTNKELARAQALYTNKVRELNAQLNQVPGKLNPMAGALRGMGGSMLAMAGVGGGLYALKEGIGQVLDKTKQFESIRKRFEYAFGSADEAARQMDFVRDAANGLVLDLINAANGYSQLASATKNLNISHQQTQQIFSGVASAVAAMGLSADESNGVFLALSQIAGKGKVSMEELRQQLGERLTPAMAIAAQSMGVTTAELEKMVESGISAENFLPKFGAALEQSFSADAAKNLNTLNGQINLLHNRFNEMLNGFGKGGVADGAVAVLQDIGDMLDWLRGSIDEMDATLSGGMRDAVVGLYEGLKEGFAGLLDIFGGVLDNINVVGEAMGVLSGNTESDFSLIKSAIDGVNIVIGTLRDGIAGVGIAVDLMAGVAVQSFAYIAEGLSKITFGELSDNFEQAAARLSASAERHFSAAHQAAMDFESKTAQALGRAAETESERFTRLEQEAKQAYQSATQAAIESAEKAKQAQQAANAAIGTELEKSAQKQANEAQKIANRAAAEAQKMEQAWLEAYAKIGDDAGLIEKVVKPLADAGLSAKKAADSLSEVSSVLADAKAAAGELGVGLRSAMDEATPALASALENVDKLMLGFDEMKSAGIDSASIIRQAVGKMLDVAQNEADIGAVQAKLQDLGENGALSMGEVEQAIVDANIKLLELSGTTDPVALAFKKLGIQTKEALRLSAGAMMASFDMVKNSGQATAGELKKAFAKVAQAALASSDASAKAWVDANAASYQYQTTASAGQVGLKNKTKSTTRAIKAQAAASREATKESQEATTAQAQAGENAIRTYKKLTLALFNFKELSKEASENLTKAILASANHANAKPFSEEYTRDIKRAASATEWLTKQTENGTVSMQGIAQAASTAHSRIAKLDSNTLNKLQAAIDSAKAKLQSLRDEAATTREALERDLADQRGDSEMVESLEQSKKLKELNAKLDAAQKSGDAQAIGDYQKSLRLQQEIYQEKIRQRALDKQKEEEAKRQAEENKKQAAEEKARREAEQIAQKQASEARK